MISIPVLIQVCKIYWDKDRNTRKVILVTYRKAKAKRKAEAKAKEKAKMKAEEKAEAKGNAESMFAQGN